jgi:arylsulfatase A-like enzyme
MLPALRGENTEPLHENLYWSYAHPNRPEEWAIRQGRWKLVKDRKDVELYDLQSDIGETKNLVEQKPERAQKLLTAFKRWRGQLRPPLWVEKKNVKDWRKNMAPPVGPDIKL